MRRLLTALLIVVTLAAAAACGSEGSDTATTSDDADGATDDDRTDAGDTGDGPADPGDTGEPPADPGDTGDDAASTRPADGEDRYAIAGLRVTVTHPDVATVSYTLSCFGDTATVTGSDAVEASDACVALKQPDVVTLLRDGPPTDRICTEQYGGPDEARITGTLADRAVDVTITRTDGCGISDWDSVLADVLPPAVGVTG